MEYIQARRQYKKFKSLQNFKKLILSAAHKFEETYDEEGIQ